jgi:hypothetical protein
MVITIVSRLRYAIGFLILGLIIRLGSAPSVERRRKPRTRTIHRLHLQLQTQLPKRLKEKNVSKRKRSCWKMRRVRRQNPNRNRGGRRMMTCRFPRCW